MTALLLNVQSNSESEKPKKSQNIDDNQSKSDVQQINNSKQNSMHYIYFKLTFGFESIHQMFVLKKTNCVVKNIYISSSN